MNMFMMLIFVSFVKLMIIFMYYFSLVLGLSSFSWFFMWISLEMNLFMYMFMYKKMSQSLINSLMKYFIIQGLSSNLFFISILLMKYNYLYSYLFFFIIYLTMLMKIGFFPFSLWFFQISEMLEWKLWFYLNSLQKLIPLVVISKNFLNLNIFFYVIYMNFLYSGLEMFIQSSFRWMINCSSMIHFSWILLSIKGSMFVWQFFFFMYFFFFYILYKFLMNKNLKCYLNLFLLNSLESMMYLMILLFNFMGLPPFIGFFLKILVLNSTMMYMLMFFMMMFSLVSLILYFYFLSPLMMILINFGDVNLLKNLNFFFVYSFLIISFYFLMMIL